MMKPDERRLWLTYGWRVGGPYAPRWVRFLDVAEELGMPHNRARYLAMKWTDRDLFEYGTSWATGWLTTAGWERVLQLGTLFPSCPACGLELRAVGDGSTLLGVTSPPGHLHDGDNLRRVLWRCEAGHGWSSPWRVRCPALGCAWTAPEGRPFLEETTVEHLTVDELPGLAARARRGEG